MSNSTISRKFNLLYLVVAVLWPLIKAQYLGGIDGAGRVEHALILCAIAINGKDLLKVPSAIWVWGIWIVFSIINTQTKGFLSDNITYPKWVVNQLVFPFVTMLVSYKACVERFDKTISVLFFTYLVYVILGAVGMTVSSSYDVGTRMQNEMGNAFFNTSILLTLFASLMYQDGKLKKVLFYIALALITYVIVISGERKGLIALFIMILGALYAMNMNKGAKSIVNMIVILLIVAIGINLVMEYASFGDRMRHSMAESQFEDNLFLQLMGDRGIMYYDGWRMFLDNMWTGIGLTNFRWENDFFPGLPLHTEYMVQLCECGILGSVLFIIFFWSMIKGLRVVWKTGALKERTIIIASCLLAILAINLVSWTYDDANYFAVYGLILAFNQGWLKNEKDILY